MYVVTFLNGKRRKHFTDKNVFLISEKIFKFPSIWQRGLYNLGHLAAKQIRKRWPCLLKVKSSMLLWTIMNWVAASFFKIIFECYQGVQNVKKTNPFFVKINTLYITVEKALGYFCNLKKNCQQINSCSRGENSPNLVTLNVISLIHHLQLQYICM
jgi:hypothetical protein